MKKRDRRRRTKESPKKKQGDLHWWRDVLTTSAGASFKFLADEPNLYDDLDKKTRKREKKK